MPAHDLAPTPVPGNRAERRAKKNKAQDPVRGDDLSASGAAPSGNAFGAGHPSAGPARPARSSAQGRRVNPVRRTG